MVQPVFCIVDTGLHRFRQRWNFEGFGGDRLALRALQANSEALKANSDPLEVDGAALQAHELVAKKFGKPETTINDL